MNAKSIFISLILVFSLGFVVAQNFQQGNKHYSKVNDKWYLVDSAGSIIFEVERVITVKFNNGISDQQKNNLYSATNVTVLRENSLRFIDLRIDSTDDVVQILQQYINSGFCQVAELNTFGHFNVIPNDPQFVNQWYLDQISDADIDAPEAWDIVTGNPDIVIAILDNGTDWDHVDLGKDPTDPNDYGNIWLNPGEDTWADPNNPSTGNGIDDDGNGFVDDWKGWDFAGGPPVASPDNDTRPDPPDIGNGFVRKHGTRVAGIAAAKTHNSTGIAGVAGGFGNQGSLLMILKLGTSGVFTGPASILDDGILYAAENGANIIQMSLSVAQTDAIDAALQAAWHTFGVFIVDAAGNNANSSVAYPANSPFVFAVGATDQNDTKWINSNFGSNLDIAAPGVNILSTEPDNTYGSASGTSFAAPQVSGVAALMLSVNPCLSNEDIKSILQITADKVGGYNYTGFNGPGISLELSAGRLNAFNAVQMAASFTHPANILLQNQTIAGNKVYTATGTIQTGQFTVAQGANVTFRAVDEIVFDDSTVIEGEMEAFIIDPITCAPQCRIGYFADSIDANDNIVNNETEIQILIDKNTPSYTYPNPFSDHTHIDYYVKKESNVTISVFNICGQKIITLVNNSKHPKGRFTTTLDANNLTAGMYYYTLSIGDTIVEKHKMFKVKKH